MSDKNQLLVAIITTGLAVGGWLSADIRELRMKADRNTETIVRLEGKVDRNTETIARLEGILIGDNRPVPAAAPTATSAPDQTALK